MRHRFLGVIALVMACGGYGPADPVGPGDPGELPPVASVVLQSGTADISVGRTMQLRVFLYDAAGREVGGRSINYTSSDERVLIVDSTGVMLAVAPGEATLTVTSEGKSAQARVTVRALGDDCAGCWDSPRP